MYYLLLGAVELLVLLVQQLPAHLFISWDGTMGCLCLTAVVAQ